VANKDNRDFTRVSVRVLAEACTVEDGVGFFGHLRDLSLRGAFVEGVRGFSEGQACRLELLLGEPGTEARICASCTVIRTEEKGVGLRFEEVEAEGMPHLMLLVLSQMDVPPKILEELEKSLRLN
jgi:hypothetical protein